MPKTKQPARPERGRDEVNPNDKRYPRRRWRWAIRAVLEALWVSGVIGYFAAVGFNVLGVFTGDSPVTGDAVLNALFLARLVALARSDPLAAAAVVVGVIALTLAAYLARRDSQREKAVLARRAEYEKLAAYYTLKRVRDIEPERDGLQIARYVSDVYLKRHDAVGMDAEAEARQALAEVRDGATAGTAEPPLGILVVGRPTLGKTRFAWEAAHDVLGDSIFVTWPHGDAPELDYSLVAGETVALWLDNAQQYASDREAAVVNELPGRFSGARLVVVATSRDGDDLDAVESKLAPLVRRLVKITLADITDAEEEQLARELEREGETVYRDEEDGTPGALLLGVRAMREERFPALPPGAQAALKAMAVLYSAGTYDYPARRVRAVAYALFGLDESRGAWDAATAALVASDFVRLGQAVDEQGLRPLEPVADVYLERGLRDFPPRGGALTDYWPGLQDALTRLRDDSALFDLGSAYDQLRIGLNSAVPYDLRPARQRAEQCFREVLRLIASDDPNWAQAQNNLGNALGQQAGLATGEEQRRLLGAAVDAYQQALSASTPGTPDWAQAQNNLGVALGQQAGLATGEEQRRLLGAAVAAYRAALTVRTREYDPNGWANTQFNIALLFLQRAGIANDANDAESACRDLDQALRAVSGAEEVYRQGRPNDVQDAIELRQVIEQAMAELGCGPGKGS